MFLLLLLSHAAVQPFPALVYSLLSGSKNEEDKPTKKTMTSSPMDIKSMSAKDKRATDIGFHVWIILLVILTTNQE